MQHVGTVEIPFPKWQRKRAASVQRDAVLEPDPFADRLSCHDIFRGEIDPVDPTAIAVRRKPCRSANAASDIENMLFGREFELIEKMFRRLAATDMELIDGREVVHRHGID